MSRTIFNILFVALTALLISKPPRYAAGLPPRYTPVYIQDTTRRPTVDLSALDSLGAKAEQLRQQTEVIKANSLAIDRDSKKLLQVVKAGTDTDPADTIHRTNTVTVYMPGDEKVITVRDTSNDHRTWWGKYFSLMKECKLHGLFKKKKK